MKNGTQLRAWLRENLTKPRGVMTAVILLAVSAAVFAGVTFGWYDFLRETQAGTVELNSEGQMVNVDGFTLFTYENEEYGISADKTTITLKSFDSVFGKNSETPVYILIPVSGEAVQQPGYDLKFTFACGNNTLLDGGKIKPLFSNVAQVRYVVVNDPSGLTSYEAARSRFYAADGSVQPGVSTPVCFASFTVDSDRHNVTSSDKSPTVTLSAPGYSAAGVQYVLFELDYNFDLVTGFIDNYASDISGRLDLASEIKFDQDSFNITVSASYTS